MLGNQTSALVSCHRGDRKNQEDGG